MSGNKRGSQKTDIYRESTTVVDTEFYIRTHEHTQSRVLSYQKDILVRQNNTHKVVNAVLWSNRPIGKLLILLLAKSLLKRENLNQVETNKR